MCRVTGPGSGHLDGEVVANLGSVAVASLRYAPLEGGEYGAFRPQSDLGSITYIDPHHDVVGSADSTSSQSDRARTVSRRVSEASDLSVTKPVVDEREKLSCCCYPADVAATAFRHPLVEVTDLGASVVSGDCFDR